MSPRPRLAPASRTGGDGPAWGDGVRKGEYIQKGQPVDPAAIGSPEWREIGKMLTNLWVVVLFVVLFAANVILGHNSIPSLVATGHIPVTWQKTRPVFYALAFVFFGLAVFFLYRVVVFAGVLRDFWPDYWI